MRRRKLTDAELLATDLIVTDAYAQGGLTLERLPPDVQVVDAIQMYRHARYPRDKVFCCICGSHRHQIGYRVVCSDGRESPLGSCCAKPWLGTNALEAIAALKKSQTRKDYVLEFQAMGPRALRAIGQLGDWWTIANAIRAKQTELFLAMPQVYELLVQSAKRDGILLATERVRKLKWQSAKGTDVDGKGDGSCWEHLPVRHVMRGRLFLQETDPCGLCEALESAIAAFGAVAESTGKYPTLALKKTCIGLRGAVDGLRKLGEMKQAAHEFFSAESLNGIVRWATLLASGHDHTLRERIATKRGALIDLGNGQRVSAPQLPQDDPSVIDLLTYRAA